MNNKILHLFTNIDMRNGHDGLMAAAKKEKVDVAKLNLGEFALFINRRRTGMKVYAANNTLIYYRAPDHRPIDVRALHHLPQFIDGVTIGYDAALGEVFKKKYPQLYKVKKK